MKKRKKRQLTNKKKRLLMVNAFLVLFLFLGIGYSFFNANLNILGDVLVKKALCEPDNKLYNIIKCESENTGKVKEYEGDSNDSPIAQNPSNLKKVYYYTYEDGNNSDELSNNVIFGNHCWQVVRTTTTDGVKLLYNGVVSSDNKCLDSREPSYGPSSRYDSGMLYNKDYYYSDSFEYDEESATFTLSGNVFQYNFTNDGNSDFNVIKDKYTCRSLEADATCSTLYLNFAYVNNSVYSYILKKSPVNYNFGYYDYNGEIPAFSGNDYNSNAYAGYMYNKVYKEKSQPVRSYKTIVTTEKISSNGTKGYYSDSVTWNNSSGCWVLSDPQLINLSDDVNTINGKFVATSQSTNCAKYAARAIFNNNTGRAAWDIYVTNLGKDSTCVDHPCPAEYYSIGDSYVKNGDGTITMTNPTIVSNIDWIYDYSNYNEKYMCMSNNSICNDVYRISSVSSSNMRYEATYYLANNFTYIDGKYHLQGGNDYSNLFNDPEPFNNNHYTCFNNSGVCEKLNYVYYFTDGSGYSGTSRGSAFYVELENGESVEDVINNTFFADNVNQKDSFAKFWVDKWYEINLTQYSDYLDDVIYCANRSVSNYAGWNKNGGDVQTMLNFNNPGLLCPNETDQFSTVNTKAKLKYPVGLLTKAEYDMLNYQTTSNTASETFWLMNPKGAYCGISAGSSTGGIYTYVGGYNYDYNHISNGVGIRPVVTLEPGITILSGDGSKENPYIIQTN